MSRIKIIVHAPPEAADEVRRVAGEAGAGTVGEYTFCSFSVAGTGRYMPSNAAKPYRGESGILSEVTEESIEFICDRSIAKAVIAAIRAVHPYEEPAIEIYQLVNEEEL